MKNSREKRKSKSTDPTNNDNNIDNNYKITINTKKYKTTEDELFNPEILSPVISSNVNNSSVVTSSQEYQLFEKSKIVVFMDPFHPLNPGIMIHSTQQRFRDVFLYPPNVNPFSFDLLIGAQTCNIAISRMNNSILLEKSHLEDVILYRSNRRPLSCHVAIQCITGNPNSPPLSLNPDYPPSYRWAVITLRSIKLVTLVKEELDTFGTSSLVADTSL